MIVKNEHDHLRACLESVKPHIGYWVISDTGSVDDTKDIVAEVLGDIPGRLYDLPFVHFGHNRSEVFAAIKGMCQWAVCSDADMVWEIDPDFEPNPMVEAYMLKMGSADFEYRLPLLLRGDLPWKSVGPVHEYTTLPNRTYVGVPTDAMRVQYTSTSSPEKSVWHATLLEDHLAKHPDDSRSVFYLAQTYRDLGREADARAFYAQRVAMSGFVEEAFYSAYRGALLEPTWPERLAGLLKAWQMRPSRIEPLHDLVRELNSRGEHQAAYRLATTPFAPSTDLLFVHTAAWRWGMTFERSIAAYWVGEIEESLALCDDLLVNPAVPDHVRKQVETNRAFCLTKQVA